MKRKRLYALVLTLSMLLTCIAFAIPVAADVIDSEVLGASIRLEGVQGLRFVGKIRKSGSLHPGAEANFGFLLLPKSKIAGQTYEDELTGEITVVVDEITTATQSVKMVPAVNLLKEEDVEELITDYAGDYDRYYYFTAVITGIPAEFYGTDILARVYVTVNEETQYSAQAERSVQYVANAINEMGGEVPAAITEVLALYEELGNDILVNADLFWNGLEPPEPGDDPGGDPEPSFTYKYVAIIGVDGAGTFDTNTPNIDRIFENGATTNRCLVSSPSWSGQGWGSAIHGVAANYHQLTNSSISSNRYPEDSLYPSFFKVVREYNPDVKMASIVEWDPINYGIIEENIGVDKITVPTATPGIHTDEDGNQYYADSNGAIAYTYKDSSGTLRVGYRDILTTKLTCEYLAETIPTVLYVHLGDPDYAGEMGGVPWAGSSASYQFNGGWGGFGTAAYKKQITVSDAHIGEIYAMYEAAGVLEDTLFIVTADHGGKDHAHGGMSDEEMYVLFAVAGKTVAKNSTIEDVELRDLPAIVTHALGLESPSTWTARVPSGLFEGVTAQERPLPTNKNTGARVHTTIDTPANSLTWLQTNISKELEVYMPLDGGSLSDATGNHNTAAGEGKLYYPAGYYGDSVVLDDGYIMVDDYAPGTSAFSISFWLKTNGSPYDSALISNKDWESGLNKGWVLALRNDRLVFNYGNTSSRRDVHFSLPADYRDGWMYVTLVVNPSASFADQVKLYYDFVISSPVSNSGMNLSGENFTNGNTLYIGQDSTEKYHYRLPGFIDDFMIFNGALTSSDVETLKAYYEGNDDSSDFHYKYVAIIGIDGAGGSGNFMENAYTPNIDSIFANGATTYECLTATPSYSDQCWGSLMHGVSPNYHNIASLDSNHTAYPADSDYPSIFRVLHEQNSDATMASIANWIEINGGIVENGIGVEMQTVPTATPGIHTDANGNQYYADSNGKIDFAYKDSNGNICLNYRDILIRDQVCSYLDSTIPTLLYVHLDGPDYAGHQSNGVHWAGSSSYYTFNGGYGGFGSQAYMQQITLTDEMVGEIYAKYEAAGVLDETLFIVTTDHGGNGNNHGDTSDSEMYVFWGAAGKTVAKGSTIEDIELRDTAAIVAYALGLEAPSTWTARVPSGLFEGVEAQERPVPMENNSGARQHTNVNTPANALTWVEDNISKSLYLYLPLDDGDYSDATGNKTVTAGGTLYDPKGYYGDAVVLDDGYLSVSSYYPGTNDFSISFWINTSGTPNAPLLFSNKDWESGGVNTLGWTLFLHNNRITFNYGDGSGNRTNWYPFPSDYTDGWMHVILTVNHSANQIKLYYDFVEKAPTRDATISITGKSFTNGSTLYIGQDTTQNYKYHLPGYLDDIMIFNGVLTTSDIAALKTYYGK